MHLCSSVEFREHIGNQAIETFVFLPKAVVKIFCFIKAVCLQRLLCHHVYLTGKIAQLFVKNPGAGIFATANSASSRTAMAPGSVTTAASGPCC